MPPAASGSENPRGQKAPKAPVRGPKRTPRPDGPTNGSAPANGVDGATDALDELEQSNPPGSAAGRSGPVTPSRTGAADETNHDPAPSPDATAAIAVAAPAPPADATVLAADATGRTGPGQRRQRPPSADPDLVDTGRRKGRRVRRVVRRIDLWSVLKLAIVLYTCLYAAVMATLALLWGLAYSSGQIEKVQSFMADVGMDNYRFYGDQMWRACAMIGAVGVLAATVVTVLTAALVNVISEMTGGIRLVVIEEDPPPRRR